VQCAPKWKLPAVAARGQGWTHDLKYCVHKVLVQRGVLEKQAEIERTVEQIEHRIRIEVGAKLST